MGKLKQGTCARPNCGRKIYARHYCYKHKSLTPVPTGYVSPDKAREHLEWLSKQGVSAAEMSRQSGVVVETIHYVLNGRAKQIYAVSEQRLLEVSANLEDQVHGLVPRLGSVRRLQALMRAGHTQVYLGERLGCRSTEVGELLRFPDLLVRVGRAKQIAALYRELELVPGPNGRARKRGERRGWAPPLAWDEGTIDDPDAKPNYGEREWVKRVDEYRELRDMGVSTYQLEQRWGAKSVDDLRRRTEQAS